jgi:hypothetical protein
LPGDGTARRDQFTKSYIRLTDWLVAAREQKLRERVAESRKAQRAAKRRFEATSAALSILHEAIVRWDDPSFDIEASRARLFATGLSKEELLELFERSTTPPTTVERRNHAAAEADLLERKRESKRTRRAAKRAQQHLRDDRSVLDAASRLFESATKFDDVDAATALHATAQTACAFLGFLVRQKPELLKPTARISQTWPMFIGVIPESLKEAEATLDRLELGADTIYGRLRTEKAFQEATPARTYARVLVETIWTNRLLIPELSERLHAMEVMDPDLTTNFESLPNWFRSIAALPAFSTNSVNQWGKAAREILRTECPDFHLRPEWASVRRAFHPRERGRIQNKILYNIVSAMRTIARAEGSPREV